MRVEHLAKGLVVSREQTAAEGSYQHLNRVVVAFLQGRKDLESAVRAILDAHSREQIRAVLLNEVERYRRFNGQRFRDLVERLRLRGMLW